MLTSYFIVLGLALAVAADFNCIQPLAKSPDECCPAMPMFVTEEVVRACGLNDMDETPGMPPCEPFACILRKVNLITSDNKLDRANVENVINSLYTSEWSSAIAISLPTCLAVLNSNPSDCEARQFSMCFIQHMLMNCPSTHWITSQECSSAKDFLMNCIPPAM